MAATADYCNLFAQLGQRSGFDLVTPEARRLGDVCDRFAAAAKPSGAGAGDIAVVFTEHKGHTQALHAALRRERFDILDLAIHAPGVQLEEGT